MMNETTRGILAITTAAAMYALTGFFVRFLTALRLNVYSINFIELLIGLPLIFLSARITREKIHWPMYAEVPWLAVIGLCHFGVTMTLFYAYNYTTIANVEFLHYTFPILTVLGAAWLFRERLDNWKIVALAMSGAGLLLIFNPTLTLTPEMRLGNLLAFASALPISVMTLAGRRLKNRSAYFTTFWSALVATTIYFPFFITHNSLGGLFSSFSFGLKQVGAIALASLVFMAVAAPLYYYGLRHVEASKAGILLLMEIVVATVAAAVFYREVPTLQEFFGGALILLSGVVVLNSKPLQSPFPEQIQKAA
jgi:drug/metabolite transporter (DMT)-like permease